ncbi:MAG: hypothetical protein QXE61_01210 [Nitrososphaerota archaeon]
MDYSSGSFIRRIRGRIISASIITIILFILLYFSSTIPISEEEAKILMEEAKKILSEKYGVLDIFIHNFMIALLMFLPIIGIIIGGYAIYTTGKLIGVLANTYGIPSSILIISTIITLYGLIEFLAYGIAFSENIFLTKSIISRRLKREGKLTIISIALTALLLLIAATIEYALIIFIEKMLPESMREIISQLI